MSNTELGLDHSYPADLFTKGALEEANRWVEAQQDSPPAPILRSSSPVDVVIRAPGHGDNGPIKRIVVHRMEAPLRVGVAVSVARWFASGSSGRNTAAHYSVDPGTTVLSVPDEELCYHAPPNLGSIGIEQAGYCANNDWRSPLGDLLLHRTARLAADLCSRHFLPKKWLSAADILAGKKGITSHHQVSLAYHQSTHTDPDPYFPVDYFLSLLNPTPLVRLPPMFDPPLQVAANIRDGDKGPIMLEVTPDGSVYVWDEVRAQYYGPNAEFKQRHLVGHPIARASWITKNPKDGYYLFDIHNDRYEFSPASNHA